jgi:ribosomal protein S18 acetylase RimI-like enzyme
MSEGIRARILRDPDRARALEYLRADADENLVLLDYVERLGGVLDPGEMPSQIYGGFDGDRLVGVVLLRPCVAMSWGMTDRVLEALTPPLMRVPSGLMKSERRVVERTWKGLEALGRRSIIDRVEIGFRLLPDRMVPAEAASPGVARPARSEDLEELVYAARASLWEEDRPDPADGDPAGFRRWVQSRLSRARIVSEEGRMVFVAYADVRRPEGWLIQGVYTWPEARRRGFARRGMDSIIREAFASGASHVQLAVVEGNERASALYRELGFEPFEELRTILFS